MPNNDVASLWGHGFVKTQKLTDCDNVGAYLTAYLTDIETNDVSSETKTYTDENGNTISKKIKKGGRLHLYDTNTKLFRCSRGIKKPKVKTMTFSNFIRYELPEEAILTYSKTIEINKEDFQNIIIYHTYKIPLQQPKTKEKTFIEKIINEEILQVTDDKILECF